MIQMSREHAVRRAGHITVSRGVAVGAPADSGASLPGAQRRYHLRHRPDVHLHAGAGAALPLSSRRRHHAHHQPHRPPARHHRHAVDPATGYLTRNLRLSRSLTCAISDTIVPSYVKLALLG